MNNFVESDFQHWPLLAVSFHTSAIFLALVAIQMLFQTDTRLEISKNWTLWSDALCSIFSSAMAGFAYYSESRSYLIKNYNIISGILIIVIYLNVIWHGFNQDKIRVRNREIFGPYIDNVISSERINLPRFQSPLLNQSICPIFVGQEMVGKFDQCNTSILSGTLIGIQALIAILPAILRMEWKSAVVIIIIQNLVMIFAVLSTGHWTWLLFSALMFQSGTGLLAVLLDRKSVV